MAPKGGKKNKNDKGKGGKKKGQKASAAPAESQRQQSTPVSPTEESHMVGDTTQPPVPADAGNTPPETTAIDLAQDHSLSQPAATSEEVPTTPLTVWCFL